MKSFLAWTNGLFGKLLDDGLWLMFGCSITLERETFESVFLMLLNNDLNSACGGLTN